MKYWRNGAEVPEAMVPENAFGLKCGETTASRAGRWCGGDLVRLEARGDVRRMDCGDGIHPPLYRHAGKGMRAGCAWDRRWLTERWAR